MPLVTIYVISSEADDNLLGIYEIVEGVNTNLFVDEAGPEEYSVFAGGRHIYDLDGTGD